MRSFLKFNCETTNHYFNTLCIDSQMTYSLIFVVMCLAMLRQSFPTHLHHNRAKYFIIDIKQMSYSQ